ncbi:MAG: hypothetical protein ACI9QQ_003089 [Myxococcota bacterium]|jgi:uncharacterized protein YhhL (DUF1145 family)
MANQSLVLNLGKILVAALWVATVTAVVTPGQSTLLEAGRLAFWCTAAAHVVECLIFLPTLRGSGTEANRSLGENILLTLIFGVFHYATLKLEASDEPAA